MNIYEHDGEFLKAIISKKYHSELSERNKNTATNDEKLEIFKKLHQYCKSKNIKKDFVHSILIQMLIYYHIKGE